MYGATSSNYPVVLKITRTLSLLSMCFFFLYYCIMDNRIEYFLYMTNWGLIITFTYFSLALLNYFFSKLDSVVCSLFLVLWEFNIVITFFFWGILVPLSDSDPNFRGTSTHLAPILCTLIEFSLNKIQFDRKKYIIPVGTLVFYLFDVLIPFSFFVAPIYVIDFSEVFHYFIIALLVLIAFAALELGKFLRGLINKSDRKKGRPDSEAMQPLL